MIHIFSDNTNNTSNIFSSSNIINAQNMRNNGSNKSNQSINKDLTISSSSIPQFDIKTINNQQPLLNIPALPKNKSVPSPFASQNPSQNPTTKKLINLFTNSNSSRSRKCRDIMMLQYYANSAHTHLPRQDFIRQPQGKTE